ncbi:MAG: PLP-dependent aminotransferase family protein [Candidatus Obscuribacterales bacterium]|nr:PLP-dependent aminotransferase family protein [Candidatus Obscuribacterales bacterium]
MNWLDILGPSTQGRDRRYPVYARLKDRLRDCIQNGQIPEAGRLPADRELAGLLGVDRSTVARAYNELEAEGFVESAVGRGTFVVYKGSFAEPKSEPFVERKFDKNNQSSGIIWQEKFSRFSEVTTAFIGRQPAATPANRQPISFAAGVPSLEFFPENDFESIVSELSSQSHCREMFAYTDAAGHPALRAEVLKHLAAQGISAREEELLILSGSQQGIDLVARTFIDDGDNLAIEDPSYFWALCNFTAFGAKTLPVSVDDEGLNLNALESTFARRRVKLLYVMPSFQNPTGTSLPTAKRRELLQMARHYQVGVFEDNFVGDLNYEPEKLPSLRSFEGGEQTVIYQSTISKSLCPGLRIGWMLAPEQAMSRLLISKRVSDLSTNSMSQVILAEYLRRGLYQNHLQTIKDAYSARRDMMCKALSELLPNELQFAKPKGGMFIWARLPYGYSARELLSFAEQEGVLFSPGDLFFAGGDRKEFFRLSFVQSNQAEIEEGMQRLAKAVKSYLSSKRRKDRSESLVNMRAGPNVFV